MAKQNIYDNEIFYENFRNIRATDLNFNDVMETPIITEMLPDLRNKRVLDIGIPDIIARELTYPIIEKAIEHYCQSGDYWLKIFYLSDNNKLTELVDELI